MNCKSPRINSVAPRFSYSCILKEQDLSKAVQFYFLSQSPRVRNHFNSACLSSPNILRLTLGKNVALGKQQHLQLYKGMLEGRKQMENAYKYKKLQKSHYCSIVSIYIKNTRTHCFFFFFIAFTHQHSPVFLFLIAHPVVNPCSTVALFILFY